MRFDSGILPRSACQLHAVLLGVLVGLLPAAAQAAPRVLAHRVIEEGDRASVMLVVQNDSRQSVRWAELGQDGGTLDDLMQLEGRHRVGKTIDWTDVRGGHAGPGEAATVIIGYARRDWLRQQPVLELVNAERTRREAFKLPALKPSQISVVSAGFDDKLQRLTLLLRNDTRDAARIDQVLFNGRPVRTDGGTIPAGQMTKLVLPTPGLERGADCNVVVDSSGGQAVAWMRALPARSLTYMFYSRWCDPRDLAEKNIDVGTRYLEANAEFGRQIDSNGGQWPEAVARELRSRVEQFNKQEHAWGWYIQDDAGWGHPTPRSLLKVRQFIREHGSEHPQIVCNPADNVRYAWTGDLVMNYAYHVTHQTPDPTQFTGGRSLDLVRRLNAPNPIIYLVDTVGQGVRWITVAEEELASYAMLGRGASYLGWFLGPSMWEQGAGRGGATDPFDDQPWRYQEGLTANTEIGLAVSRLALVFRSLSEEIAVSAPFSGHQTEQGVEVLPVYAAKGDLVMATLLNRRMRCVYPRDLANQPMAGGGIRLEPKRDFQVTLPRVDGRDPALVLGFDHDRGVRSLPFEVEGDQVRVQVDALDSAGLVLTVPERANAERLRGLLASIPRNAGSGIRPDAVYASEAVADRQWRVADAAFRTRVTIEGPVRRGEPIRLVLPTADLEPWEPNGFFDPDSAEAFLDGASTVVKIDHGKLLARAEDRGRAFRSGRTNDPRVRVQRDRLGVKITSRYSDGYGLLQVDLPFDPRYPVLDIAHELNGRIAPLLHYKLDMPGGAREGSVNLYSELDRWQYWPRSKRVLDATDQRLAVTRIRLRESIAAQEGMDPHGPWTIESLEMSGQLYEGVFRFGDIVQRPDEPAAFLIANRSIAAGETAVAEVYWNRAGVPSVPSPRDQWPDDTDREVRGGVEITGAHQLSVQKSARGGVSIVLAPEANLDHAWIESRTPAGELLNWAELIQQQGRWEIAGFDPVQDDAELSVWSASEFGPTVKHELQAASSEPMLTPIAQVAGQVETLAASPAGDWILAGAQQVTALSADGETLWTRDPGEHRRQPRRYGPGRNVAAVGIGPDGEHGFAWTFSFDSEKKLWRNAKLEVLDADGRVSHERVTHWQQRPVFGASGHLWWAPADGSAHQMLDPGTGRDTVAEMPVSRANPAAGGFWIETIGAGWPPRLSRMMREDQPRYEVQWPAYALHRRPLPGGRLAIGTTQGHVHLLDGGGRLRWQITRPSRIEQIVPLPTRGLLAVARKEHAQRWGWSARPIVELLRLSDGSIVRTWKASAVDDMGHLGTDLQLAADERGTALFLGDSAGRIFRINLNKLSTSGNSP